MKLTKYFMPFAALALLASCSNDNLDVPGNDNQVPSEGSTGGMYVTLNVTQLSGTRALETEEAGQTFETGIGSAVLYLVDQESKKVVTTFVVSTGDDWTIEGSSASGVPEKAKQYTMTGKVDRDEMLTLAGDASSANKYDLYVVCNPGSDMLAAAYDFSANNPVEEKGSSESYDDFLKKYADPENGRFMMSNADGTDETLVAVVDFTSHQFTDLDKYATPADAYKFGTVKVQRAVARFDYKDGGEEYSYTPTNNQNVKITLTGMSLVNVGQGFNLFKQVAVGVDQETGWTYFKPETPSSTEERYVFNPRYKANLDIISSGDPSNRFHNPLFAAGSNPTEDTPKQVELAGLTYFPMKALSDNSENYSNTQGYDFWCYAITNTIHNKDNQKKAISTGVIFRALIEPGDDDSDSKFKAAVDGSTHGDIYAINNEIIGTFADLKAYVAISANADKAATLNYNNVVKELALDADGQTDQAMRAKLVENGFSIYTWEDQKGTSSSDKDYTPAGYYCYYTYMNKHNDNNSAAMGPMEFGVVRNNIYKLSVTTINDLGHPSDPDDDPDPNEPGDPDEEVKTYITVDVQVIPWTVRENNITF